MKPTTISDILTALKNENLLCEPSLQVADSETVSSVSYDSRTTERGAVFVCKGFDFKPLYLARAIERGATFYVSEIDHGVDIPLIKVTDSRAALAVLSVLFHRDPASHLTLVGITGTKGKTTTCYYVKNILDAYEMRKTAVISTVEQYTGGDMSEEAHLTTPESLELQGLLSETVQNGVKHMTMEVSSQAYKMSRVRGIKFDCGVFLNIGVDHIGPLEHSDPDDYLACKLELFKNCGTAVINGETDRLGEVMKAAKQSGAKVLTYGMREGFDVVGSDVRRVGTGFTFVATYGERKIPLHTKMNGRFNISNALAAATVGIALGIPDEDIITGISKTTVMGRMNMFEKDGVTLIVDYAHNHLSFKELFLSINADYPGQRIVSVFGCPGGKNFARRRDLGRLAGEYAGQVYLTDEDPGFEDPTRILEEIAEYLKPYKVPYAIVNDREEAIKTALSEAKSGDVILITGKGEEHYQKVNGEYVPCKSDMEIVKELTES